MNGSFTFAGWLRRAGTTLLPLLAASCLNGGGRFQKEMCEGPPLSDEPLNYWRASDGVEVPCCRWLPPRNVKRKGIVIAVPGMDEGSDDWGQLGRHLSARGYEVYASDLRGQGRDVNCPERGDYHRWQRWVEDVNEFAALVRGKRSLRVAYMGHSLGGIVALHAAASAEGRGPDALVLYAPAFVLAYPPWFARPAVTLAKVATLNCCRVTGPAVFKLIGRNLVSNVEDEAAWERSSDRMRKGMSMRYVLACLDAGKHARDLPGQVTVPVLLEYGGSDATLYMCGRSPRSLCDMFQSPDKELWWHPDREANHDMVNDRLVRREMLDKTYLWLNDRLPAGAAQ
ncbi:alpha/beta fold hydrolase [Prosthecobacter sp.]|uniref:alpha/beta fold hydrolase n=1 Tax=Prosthecobacter sp. TaxID=1965333 RepID=UPI003783D96C